jgi:hypothetical protein
LKLKIAHAFWSRERDPKNKILNTFFALKIRKKMFVIEIGQYGYQNITTKFYAELIFERKLQKKAPKKRKLPKNVLPRSNYFRCPFF